MIPYMVGKLAPNWTHSTGELAKYVPGWDYFRAVPSQNRDKIVTPRPALSVERVLSRGDQRVCVFFTLRLHYTQIFPDPRLLLFVL